MDMTDTAVLGDQRRDTDKERIPPKGVFDLRIADALMPILEGRVQKPALIRMR